MTLHRTKRERRQQIMEAAITCFAEKGFYETSMDDIVKVAGLSKGSLYWYFESKRDLFKSLIEMWFEDLMEGLVEAVDSAPTANQKLSVMVDAVKETVALRPELARAQLEFFAMALRDEEIRGWLRENYAVQREFFARIVEQGIAAGEFRPVPVDAVARMIMAYFDGAWLHQELHEASPDTEAVLEEVKTTVLAVLRAEGQPWR